MAGEHLDGGQPDRPVVAAGAVHQQLLDGRAAAEPLHQCEHRGPEHRRVRVLAGQFDAQGG